MYIGALDKLDKMMLFQATEKPEKAADKLYIEGVLANLQVKLRNLQRPAFVPPKGLALEDLDAKWNELLDVESVKEKAILEEIARFNNNSNSL